MKSVWDHPDSLGILRSLWIDGMPSRAMAERLSRLTGFKVTHNAIIGKVHRLRLHVEFPRGNSGGAEAQRVTGAIKSRAKQVRKIAALNKAPKVVGIDYKRTPATAEIVAKCAVYGRDRVEWVESGAGVASLNARPFFEGSGCKWPLAGGMRCCNPISRGQYCRGHAAVAFERPAPPVAPKTVEFLTRFDGVVPVAPAEPEGTTWDEARAAA